MGTYELKGDRGYMEDRVIVTKLETGDLFAGVYDGHCGERCAQKAKDELHQLMVSYPEYKQGKVGEAQLTASPGADPRI